MSSAEKKLIPVSVDTVNKATRLAKKKLTSISKIVEDAVDYAIKIEELGFNVEKAYNILKAIKTIRVLGGVFIPQLVSECSSSENCKSNRENILKKWHESGKVYGTYLRDTSNKAEVLGALLEVLRWDISEVQVDKEGDTYRIKCTGISMNDEETEYITRFIEGVIAGLACSLKSIEYIRGLIIVKFKC
jgi:hypothetical protein